MKPPRRSSSSPESAQTPDTTPTILQFRVWLKGLSPMVWRRVQMPATMTLREFHGVLQVAMGWEGIHLYQFVVHTVRYGSWQLTAGSPDIGIDALRLRSGSRFLYEYDLFRGNMRCRWNSSTPPSRKCIIPAASAVH